MVVDECGKCECGKCLEGETARLKVSERKGLQDGSIDWQMIWTDGKVTRKELEVENSASQFISNQLIFRCMNKIE